MSFTNHDINAWLKQVAKEIGTEGVSEKKYTYFQHTGYAVPTDNVGVKLPQSTFHSVADVRSCSEKEIKQVLLTGPEVMVLFPHQNTEFIDWQYLQPIFDLRQSSTEEIAALKHNLAERYSTTTYQNFIFLHNQTNDQEVHFCITTDILGLADAVKLISHHAEHGHLKFYLQWQTGINMAENIATLRAIRIVLENVKAAIQQPDLKVLVAVMPLNHLILNVDETSLIRLNYLALSGSLGLADHIYLLPFAVDFQKARIAQNMVQIFRHEALLEEVADPASGSYYFDDITRQSAENLWYKIIA